MSMASSAQSQEAAIVLICLKRLYSVFCSKSKTFRLTPAYLITNYVFESSVVKHRGHLLKESIPFIRHY